MKKLKKEFIIIFLFIFILVLLLNYKVFASSNTGLFQKVEYSEDFKDWLELTDEEKEKVIQPRMYDILATNTSSRNLLYKARMLGASVNTQYNLNTIIPSNLTIRNQQQTYLCWALAALSSLETNLALYNYKNVMNTSKIYDFSERHMEYATSKTFANNAENGFGYNRSVGDGGQWFIAESYLTNGSGAIDETEMPFENNNNTISISEIQNKTVSSQVYDTVDFANYQNQTDDIKTEIMNEVKKHIQNYGSVFASIHGNFLPTEDYACYNISTSAIYCNDETVYKADHAVSIIGWDDNYSTENFLESARPTSNGAWIIRNSWGESVGDNGLMYVSYEDVNISKSLYGIIKATDTVNYENIYQYNIYNPIGYIEVLSNTIMMGNIFNKQTVEDEYITEVSIYAPETYTCRVYVNPNGTSMAQSDMQLVTLKAGESETFDAGYHTLEFAEPIKINANSFSVVVAIQGTRSNVMMVLESTDEEVPLFNTVTIESGKCFVANGNDLGTCTWTDLGSLSQLNSELPNGDSTIKAFTVSEVIDESLNNIEITTAPNKIAYFEGENFDATGMVITANYNNGKSAVVDGYNITNGTNLVEGQTSVTITYQDKTVNQTISVEKNSVTELIISNQPNKTEYKEGENFDITGMVIEAKYKDGTTKTITDYTIEGGNNLKDNQTQVTISYEGQTVQQAITVIPNPLIEINVTTAPDKTNYVVGQNFDKTGMVVTGTYQGGITQEIIEYTIDNGTNLTQNQTSVTIIYEGKTVTQPITVVEKSITGISINRTPSKIQYKQNSEELNLSGGSIKVDYNDGSSEIIDLTSEQIEITGFNNEIVGRNTITITYLSYTTTFDVEIVEEEIKEDEIPTNSNLDAANCKINNAKYYTFSDESAQEYLVIDITVNGVARSTNNDSYEYYYYLSSNQDEDNIEDWVIISENQTVNDKLEFEINTKDIKNYADISESNTIYLYIREVAINGGNQSVAVSRAIEMNSENVTLEVYLDNSRVINVGDDGNSSSPENIIEDPTVAPGELPQTGIISVLVLIFIISLGGVIAYVRYKHLSKEV